MISCFMCKGPHLMLLSQRASVPWHFSRVLFSLFHQVEADYVRSILLCDRQSVVTCLSKRELKKKIAAASKNKNHGRFKRWHRVFCRLNDVNDRNLVEPRVTLWTHSLWGWCLFSFSFCYRLDASYDFAEQYGGKSWEWKMARRITQVKVISTLWPSHTGLDNRGGTSMRWDSL